MEEGPAVGILIGLKRRFLRQTAYGEMRHQETVELLLDEFRRLTPQCDLRPAQLGVEFIEGGLSGKGCAVLGGPLRAPPKMLPRHI
jgi:hypothetical protein